MQPLGIDADFSTLNFGSRLGILDCEFVGKQPVIFVRSWSHTVLVVEGKVYSERDSYFFFAQCHSRRNRLEGWVSKEGNLGPVGLMKVPGEH